MTYSVRVTLEGRDASSRRGSGGGVEKGEGEVLPDASTQANELRVS